MKKRNRTHPHRYWDRELLNKFDAAIDSRNVDSIYEVGLRLGYSDWEIGIRWECREIENRQRAIEAATAQALERRRAAIANRFGVPPSYVMLEEEITEWRANKRKAKSSNQFFNILKRCLSGAAATCTQVIRIPISRAGTK